MNLRLLFFFLLRNPLFRRFVFLLTAIFAAWILLQGILWFRWISAQSTSLVVPHSKSITRNHLQKHQEERILFILSSRERVVIRWNEVTIVEDEEPQTGRGLHVVIFTADGVCTSYRIFDTYSPDQDSDLITYLTTIPSGRVIAIAVKDDASYNLGESARAHLREMGSRYVANLGFRNSWIFAVWKTNSSTLKVLEEITSASSLDPSFPTQAVQAEIFVPFFMKSDTICKIDESEKSDSVERSPSLQRSPSVKRSPSVFRRQEFCRLTDGYPDICRCQNPKEIEFKVPPLNFRDGKFVKNGKMTLPIAVIAGNRPFYLNTMLRSLLNTSGVDPRLVTVFIDGLFEEPVRLANLFGVRNVQHLPAGRLATARISQHYKASLSAIFTLDKHAEYAIVIEEDLLISPDFFSFFAQTIPFLEKDSSLFCVSAWNDLSVRHTSQLNSAGDPSLLYRVETMPGLGWVISRSIFEKELLPQWPSPLKKWDWDMWMRSASIRKDRECIVPDVSRTYHFGAKGLNMNAFFHERYFLKRSFYNGPPVQFADLDSMTKNEYEIKIRKILENSLPVNHSKNPCDSDFFPDKPDFALSVFIKMENANDTANWLAFCRCVRIWDLDVRGSHNFLWRFHVNGNQPVIVVGVPISPYSFALPNHIYPIDLSSHVLSNSSNS